MTRTPRPRDLTTPPVTDRDRQWLIAAAVLTALTCALGIVRFSVVENHTWTFLLKNMGLAWVPGLIAFGLLYGQRLPTGVFVALCALWLAFLPNAPYIITDAIHLATPRQTILWLDVLVIGSASIAGLLLTFASTDWTLRAIAVRRGRAALPFVLYLGVTTLAAFGVYFGRFARWNSWELATRPGDLIADFATRIVSSEPWFFVAVFGGCLIVGQLLFHLLSGGPGDQRPRLAPVQVGAKTSE